MEKFDRQYSDGVPRYQIRGSRTRDISPAWSTLKRTGNSVFTSLPGTAAAARNHPVCFSLSWQTRKREVKQEDVMGRGLLLWLLGIPIPIISLISVLGGLHG
jgi:hypothetical protein